MEAAHSLGACGFGHAGSNPASATTRAISNIFVLRYVLAYGQEQATPCGKSFVSEPVRVSDRMDALLSAIFRLSQAHDRLGASECRRRGAVAARRGQS